MQIDSETLTQKRQQMLKHLRERRQEGRHGLNEKGENANEEVPLEQFVKLTKSAEPSPSESVVTTPENFKSGDQNQLVKIRERLKKARNLIRNPEPQVSETENRSQSEDGLSSEKSDFSQRKEILEEFISDRFHNNIKSWISSVDPDLGVSSTSLSELEEHQEAIEYRYKVLKLLLNATQEELNKIEIYIRAVKALENK